MSFTIPEYIHIHNKEDLKVGYWDEEQKKWKTDLINPEDTELAMGNQLSFKISCFQPMALLQSRCTYYPYKSWKIRAVDEQHALLDIETKVMTLCFEIGPDYVKLIDQPQEELQHIVDKEMSPGYLLYQLSRSGIHLLPVDEDAKLAGINLKSEGAEQAAISDIICGIKSFAFRSCKWNQHSNPENIVLKIRENLEYDKEFLEDYEIDWTYIKWWEDKLAYVKTRDSTEEPTFEQEDGEETHAILPVITKDRFSEEANDRMLQYSIGF